MTATYHPIYRPAYASALPPGVTAELIAAPRDIAHLRPDLPVSAHRYGTLALSRPLTAEEREQYEMEIAP